MQTKMVQDSKGDTSTGDWSGVGGGWQGREASDGDARGGNG
jgi:hypothetical protein